MSSSIVKLMLFLSGNMLTSLLVLLNKSYTVLLLGYTSLSKTQEVEPGRPLPLFYVSGYSMHCMDALHISKYKGTIVQETKESINTPQQRSPASQNTETWQYITSIMVERLFVLKKFP